MLEDILEGALRVLRRDGGCRFTTIRVAQETGISVGSLYQYFPNKEALLFRLQTDEWARTLTELSDILDRTELPHEARLRRMVIAFFPTERDEAEIRRALGRVPVHAEPDAAAHARIGIAKLTSFFGEAMPGRSEEDVAFIAKFFMTSLSALAERVTAEPIGDEELTAWARTAADLFGRYLAEEMVLDEASTGRPGCSTRAHEAVGEDPASNLAAKFNLTGAAEG